MQRGAVISDDGLYRYSLTRSWDPASVAAEHAGPVVWVMLNPSSADASTDDNTIRRIVGFTNSFGHCRAQVVNLYAWRSTSPAALALAPDPVGPDNDDMIAAALDSAALVVAGWGAHRGIGERVARVHGMAAARNVTLHCLARTKDGHPRHPLYIRGDARPMPLERM